MRTRYRLGRLVCGLVLVMTAVPGPPGSPFRFRSWSARRGDPSPNATAAAGPMGGAGLFRIRRPDIAEASSIAGPPPSYNDPGIARPSRGFVLLRDKPSRFRRFRPLRADYHVDTRLPPDWKRTAAKSRVCVSSRVTPHKQEQPV